MIEMLIKRLTIYDHIKTRIDKLKLHIMEDEIEKL
jgi:hypothetical protein